MTEDCIRTASVITDEMCDVIVLDRDLYNRSVQSVLKQEFEDKVNFISSNPYFRTWHSRFRQQLALSLTKRTIPYGTTLVKQGDVIDALYFVLS